MGNKRQKKYTHKMVLRLDEETNALIDQYSDLVGVNKTQLIRNSISSFMFLNSGISDYPNPKSIVSQSTLHFLYDKCNEEDLKELAEITYDLGLVEFTKGHILDLVKQEKDPDFLTNILVEYGLSPRGQGWFDELKYIMKGKNVYIFGTHNIGPNFHIFMNHLLSMYFILIDYSMKEDKQNLEEIRELAKDFNMRAVKRRFYKYSVVFTPTAKLDPSN